MDFSQAMTHQQDFNFNQKYYSNHTDYNYYYTNTSTPTSSHQGYQSTANYNYFYPQIDTYTSQPYYASCTTPPPHPISNSYQNTITYGTSNHQQQHISPQLNKQEVSHEYLDSAYASQYSDPYQLNSSPSNSSPTTQQVSKSKSKKRKECEEETVKSTDEIVNKIFEEAAYSSQQFQVYSGPKSDSSTGSKRPKILKLDLNLPNQLTDCQQISNNIIQCTQCSLTFNSTAKLLMHQYKFHGNGSSTECPICFKKFGNQANALVHLRAHTQEKTYKCTQCEHAFCDSSTLKKHMRIHTGEKPYTCNICFKKFTQSGNLKRHLNVHQKYEKATSENQNPLIYNQQQEQVNAYDQQFQHNHIPSYEIPKENYYY